MSPTALKLLDGLKQATRRAHFDAYPLMYEIVLTQRDQLSGLLAAIIAEYPRGGTFFNDAISFLTLEELGALLAQTITNLKPDGWNDAVESLIAHGSLQCPQALHPHLDALLDLRRKVGFYHAWPWRESGSLHSTALKAAARRKGVGEEELDMVREALFETREPQAMNFALGIRTPEGTASLEALAGGAAVSEMKKALAELKKLGAASKPRTQTGPEPETDVDLLDVGFEKRGGSFHRLHSENARHLVFRLDYLGADKQPLHLRKQHPTWHLEDESAPALRFGGVGGHECAICGGASHHLLTLDPVPPGLGVTGLKRLTLETCLSCLGWEKGMMFYRHRDGAPTPFEGEGKKVKPRFPARPLAETRVRLASTPRRWHWQDWGSSNSRENLHRVGGPPCWIQDPDYPRCPDCRQTMQFLLQLDSDLPTAEGKEFLWGSGGIGYAFWCDACRTSGFFWQCT